MELSNFIRTVRGIFLQKVHVPFSVFLFEVSTHTGVVVGADFFRCAGVVVQSDIIKLAQ